MMTNGDCERRIYLSHPHTNNGLLFMLTIKYRILCCIKVRNMAKIRNRYNQAPHLTQDANGKVTTSHLDITKESQDNKPMGRDHYWPKGHNFNKLVRGLLGDALHQI